MAYNAESMSFDEPDTDMVFVQVWLLPCHFHWLGLDSA